eukprot:Skav221649  [mRNA]  locus=scaffold1174:287595:297013:- [translate_table: standard]
MLHPRGPAQPGADPHAQSRSGQVPSEVAKNEAVRGVIEKAETAGEEAKEPPKKKEYEGSSLSDIAAAPTSALQGVAQKGREVLKSLGSDLGKWKFYRISKSIVGLSKLEQSGKREEGAALNINKAELPAAGTAAEPSQLYFFGGLKRS